MKDVIKLVDEQVDELVLIDSGNKYKANTKPGAAGKTFSRFRFESKVFTVDDNSPFIKDFNDGNVVSVKLLKGQRTVDVVGDDGEESQETVETLEFDSHVSMARVERRAMHKARVKSYDKLATAELNAELLQQLENA